MNKNLLLSALAVLVMVSSFSTCYANEQVSIDEKKCPKQETMSPFFMKKDCPNKHKFHGKKPSRAEMNAHRVEMNKRLNLTEEQKTIRAEQKRKSHEEMKPIFEQMKAKHHEYMAVKKDKTLKESVQKKKLKNIKSDLDELKKRADEKRAEDMKNFESILNDEQKAEFAKIKEERKIMMEKRKQEFEKMKKEKEKSGCPLFPPVQPKPQPVQK